MPTEGWITTTAPFYAAVQREGYSQTLMLVIESTMKFPIEPGTELYDVLQSLYLHYVPADIGTFTKDSKHTVVEVRSDENAIG